MKITTELDTLTDTEKCRSVFRAACEGTNCELTYAELEALQASGFIANLQRVKGRRWVFEWTDKLHEFAIATPGNQKRIIAECIRECD